MERRKFVIGLGALTTGTAAAMGTGATDSIRADRSLNVAVAGDQNALLKLNAEDSTYSENSQLNIDFSSSLSDGVNNNATTSARPAFSIRNQSDETLFVEVHNPAADSDITDGGVDVQFIACNDGSASLNPSLDNAPVLFDRDETVQAVSPQRTSRDPASIPQTTGSVPTSWSGQRGLVGGEIGRSPDADPQFVAIESGTSIDVIVRIVANDVDDADLGTVFDGTVEIRAFDDPSDTYISNGPSPDVGDGSASEEEAE